MANYCTVAEVRSFAGVGSEEFDDTAVTLYITNAMARIEQETGRTWQGVQTKTDEYYDGDGSADLYLSQGDVASVTALSIDENLNGTYAPVTVSKLAVYDYGLVHLNSEVHSDIESTAFQKGPRTVKITYTYGNSSATNVVKYLTLLVVANTLKNDPVRKDEINTLMKKLSRQSYYPSP